MDILANIETKISFSFLNFLHLDIRHLKLLQLLPCELLILNIPALTNLFILLSSLLVIVHFNSLSIFQSLHHGLLFFELFVQ